MIRSPRPWSPSWGEVNRLCERVKQLVGAVSTGEQAAPPLQQIIEEMDYQT